MVTIAEVRALKGIILAVVVCGYFGYELHRKVTEDIGKVK